MSYKAVFAGNNLHDYFKILKINRTILPPKSVFTKDIPSLHGQVYTGFKYTPRVYTLECVLVAQDNDDLMDKIKTISYVLETKSPSKLILGDSPDRYNYAIVTNKIDLEKFKYNGKFEIEFTCYDPISYSVDDTEFYGDTSNIVTIENNGSTDAYPRTSIAFNNDAYFLQCTNYEGKTILVGVPNKVDDGVINYNPNVLRDNCETLSGWNSTSNIIDSGRELTGNLMVNGGGYGITLGSCTTSTNNKWYGGALRKNLGQNLENFRVEVKVEHNSLGVLKGGGSTPPITNPTPPTPENPSPPSVSVTYVVTADPSLRVRSGRGTNYSKIGSYKKGTQISITNIDKNWGQVTYNGKTGYVSMDYVAIPSSTSTSSNKSSKYKINVSKGVNLRSGAGTNYSKLTAIPNGKIVTVTEEKNGWGKTTYNSKTGWFALQYAIKQNTSKNMVLSDVSAENKLGVIEVYGFDINGTKLFKMKMSDSQKWYEYTEPEIEFGSKLVLDDNKNCPSPKTVTTTDDNNKTTTQETDSGKYGDWNEFTGWFTIERKTVNGKQNWFAKVEKVDSSGKVVRTINTQTLCGNYPTGNLNNIVIFIGGYNNEPTVDCMNVNEVYVTNLSEPPQPKQVEPSFRAGDELVIDHKTQKVYKNGKPFMEKLDIGSQFFEVPVGRSQFVCRSDADEIDIISAIQSRWL